MRRISIDSVQPGMILARAVSGSSGQILLNAGVEIKPQYIQYLKRLGIDSIYIEDNRLDDIEVDDVISEEIRREACSLIKDCMREVSSPHFYKKGLNVKSPTLSQINCLA